MKVPTNRKIVDLVKRLHAEAKTIGLKHRKDLLEEAATNLRLQAVQIEQLQEEVLRK
jgi:hypothetical protein